MRHGGGNVKPTTTPTTTQSTTPRVIIAQHKNTAKNILIRARQHATVVLNNAKYEVGVANLALGNANKALDQAKLDKANKALDQAKLDKATKPNLFTKVYKLFTPAKAKAKVEDVVSTARAYVKEATDNVRAAKAKAQEAKDAHGNAVKAKAMASM